MDSLTNSNQAVLNIDWKIYKEGRNDVQRAMKEKRNQYFEEKLSEKKRTKKVLHRTYVKKGLSFDSLSVAETF